MPDKPFSPSRFSPRRRVVLIVGVLILFQLSLLLRVERIHHDGVPVVLATAPVDPRSIFQGDYVTLSYDISRPDAALFQPPLPSSGLPPGATVYVELQPGEPVWTPVRVVLTPVQPAPGHVLIRGKSEGHGRVRYGIEAFFVPEKTGFIVEQTGRSDRSRVSVRVLVAPDGEALPDNILIDGRPVYTDGGLQAAGQKTSAAR